MSVESLCNGLEIDTQLLNNSGFPEVNLPQILHTLVSSVSIIISHPSIWNIEEQNLH
jgi:hypothetical protein